MNDYVFCTKCGNKCDVSFKFCNNCGNELIAPDEAIDVGETSVVNNINESEVVKEESKANIDVASGCARPSEKNFLKQIMKTASATLKYYGSHPRFSRECKMNLKTDASYFKFGTMFKQEIIPLSDIISVKIETEKEVIERFTATRIALLGPFALAFKKRKVNKTKYLIVECKNYVLVFEGNSFSARRFCERLYTNMIDYNK